MPANISLAAARAALNLSQEELARVINARSAGHEPVGSELRCSARQISKWEAGETRWPQARYRRALEAITGLPCSRLGFLPPEPKPGEAPPGPPALRPVPNSRHHKSVVGSQRLTLEAPTPVAPLTGAPSAVEEVPVFRREFLTTVAGLAAASFTATINPFHAEATSGASDREAPPRQAPLDHDATHQRLLELEQRELRLGSGPVLPLVEDQRRRISAALLEDTDSTELKVLSARAHRMAGWMHFDSGQQQKARRLWKEALFLSQLAGDSGNAAYVASLMSLQAAQLHRPKEAVQLARLGASYLPAAGLPAALMAVREARGWSLLGAARESTAAMHKARTALGTPGPRPDWATFFTDGEMDVWSALIARDLGRWDESESYARRCVADPHLLPRPQASFQLVLCEILVRRNDLTGAAEEIDRVLPGLAQLSSARVRGRVTDVLTALPVTQDLGGRRAELGAVA